jgi:hypothetical protein
VLLLNGQQKRIFLPLYDRHLDRGICDTTMRLRLPDSDCQNKSRAVFNGEKAACSQRSIAQGPESHQQGDP